MAQLTVEVLGGALSSASTSEKNASVSVANTTTVLIAATTKQNRTTLIKNIGDRTVYVGFGVSALTTMWPINVGDILKVGFTGAINVITASGTGTVQVLSESR